MCIWRVGPMCKRVAVGLDQKCILENDISKLINKVIENKLEK